MKASRLLMSSGAALLAVAVLRLAPLRSASAQESDLWSSQASTDSDVTPDAEVTPDATPITVTGEWQGTINDNLRGSGTITADFTQKKAKVAGSWNTFGDLGTLLGTVTNHSAKIVFTFVPKKPYIHCRFTLKSTSASDSAIIGTYKFTACGPLTKVENGTINISPVAATADAGQQ